jgi:hypothetical protein
MRLAIEKYAPLAFLMGLALLVGLSVISYRSLNDLTQTADQVTDTHLVMSKLEEVIISPNCTAAACAWRVKGKGAAQPSSSDCR